MSPIANDTDYDRNLSRVLSLTDEIGASAYHLGDLVGNGVDMLDEDPEALGQLAGQLERVRDDLGALGLVDEPALTPRRLAWVDVMGIEATYIDALVRQNPADESDLDPEAVATLGGNQVLVDAANLRTMITAVVRAEILPADLVDEQVLGLITAPRVGNLYDVTEHGGGAERWAEMVLDVND